jgi:hypothetical protein
MDLKSFGCSFIFGSDLSDCNYNPPEPKESLLTWPAHLAKKLSYNYQCYARPAAGNLQIAEKIINQSAASPDGFYVISWSWIDRFDYYNQPLHPWQPWKTLTPGNSDQLAETYYKNLHSEYRDKLSNLMYIKLVIDILHQRNIPFIMTYMDELLFDTKYNTSPAITALQDYIEPYMTRFEGKTFLDWSRNKGYPESAGWHPLEAAHSAAADIIIRAVDKQNTVDR